MLGYLIILFTIVPAIELMLLIKVGTYIGAGNTVFIIILTGVLGASLARYQGFKVLMSIQDNINKGIMPSAQLIDGFLILVGGLLLLTPGFVTDILGFVLLIPLTRGIIKFGLKKKFESMVARGQVVTFSPWSRSRENPFKDNTESDDYIDIDIK